MLYLTRKVGESVIIDDNIEITVVEVRGKTIKLGFEFPADVTVLRRELYEKNPGREPRRRRGQRRIRQDSGVEVEISRPRPGAVSTTPPA